jgi:hypothetical protein
MARLAHMFRKNSKNIFSNQYLKCRFATPSFVTSRFVENRDRRSVRGWSEKDGKRFCTELCRAMLQRNEARRLSRVINAIDAAKGN